MKAKIAGYTICLLIITAFAIREIGKYGLLKEIGVWPEWLAWIEAIDKTILFFSGNPYSDVYAFINYMGIFVGLLGIGLLRRPRVPPFTSDLSLVDEGARPRKIEKPEQAFAYSRHLLDEMPQDHAIVHEREIAKAESTPIEKILRYYEEKGAHD